MVKRTIADSGSLVQGESRCRRCAYDV